MRRGYNLEYVSSKCNKILDTLAFKYYNKNELSFKVTRYNNYKFSIRSQSLHRYFDIENVSYFDTVNEPVNMHYIVYYIDEYDMCIKDDISNNEFYHPSLSIFKNQELLYTNTSEPLHILFIIFREGFYEE